MALSVGKALIIPGLTERRRNQFTEKWRDLDEQKTESLHVPHATAWVMAGFPEQDPEDHRYYGGHHSAAALHSQIEGALAELEQAPPIIANKAVLPIDLERTLEHALVGLHELSLLQRDATVSQLIERVRAAAGSDAQLHAWCKSIQKRTFGHVAAAFSEGAQFPPEKYVQPTLLGNMMS